jgi:hypothetical protein
LFLVWVGGGWVGGGGGGGGGGVGFGFSKPNTLPA